MYGFGQVNYLKYIMKKKKYLCAPDLANVTENIALFENNREM